MSFINRGLLSLKSKKGKTCLMFIVFLSIFCLIFVGFIIQQSAKQNEITARQKLGADVSIVVDSKKMAETLGNNKVPIIESNSVEKISNLKEVKDYQLSSNGTVGKNSLKPIESKKNNSDSSISGAMSGENSESSSFMITGVRNISYHEDFKNKTNKLVNGKGINSNDTSPTAVIEEELAKINNLDVGDSIKLKNKDGEEKEFKIKGIYSSNKVLDPMLESIESAQPSNNIYINYNSFDGFVSNSAINKATFYLKDPLLIDKFILKAKKLNLIDPIFKFDANDDAYQQMVGPLKQTSALCSSIVIISIIIGSCILISLTILNIKNRKFEMGILLSLGESKLKIISQLLFEGFIIAILSFSMATLVSVPVGQSVANYTLNEQVKNSESTNSLKNLSSFTFTSNKENKYKPIKTIKVRLTQDTLMKVSILSFFLLFFSITLPGIFILRLKPSLLFQEKE
ncbi:ABC transporter permease [Lactococcus lactis]|uniref:ABC transporter permease n=1 Tax=Lactococcus lactis TaxID=1358 RepID=UPI0024A7E485|nr:ABC transporter permease [Lactococcus lactis]